VPAAASPARTPGSGRAGYCWSAWTSASHACMSRAAVDS